MKMSRLSQLSSDPLGGNWQQSKCLKTAAFVVVATGRFVMKPKYEISGMQKDFLEHRNLLMMSSFNDFSDSFNTQGSCV